MTSCTLILPFSNILKAEKTADCCAWEMGNFKIMDYPNIVEFKMQSGEPVSALISKDGLTVEVPLEKQ